ncbi:MAG: hydroxyacid dehydrogenase [Ruminococcaceae bacterium]|nr:hydroxyacid dehydrogenase [Oscillospiraceae bacterium]
MRISILDAATLGADLDLSGFSKFGEVIVHQATAPLQIAKHLEGAEVAVLNKVKLFAEQLSEAPSLKLICIAATGFDNVDLDYCRDHGIAVCNVVGYSTQCVAQVTLSMALSLITHLPEYHEQVRSGAYTEKGIPNSLTPAYHEIYGKTWGIVGFGNIGRKVGQVADALGCRVLVNKRTPISDWTCVDLETICRESDILSIHTPLNDSTRSLLDERHIAMLKRNAIVINVARGAVTDEAALARALEEGRIGGLGVDVYSVEPMPQEHPFQRILNRPNVCFTPHMAWGGYETRVRLLEEMQQNIQAFLLGKRRNRVD